MKRRTPAWLLAAAAVLFASGRHAAAMPPFRVLEKAAGGKIAGRVHLSGRIRVAEDLLVLPGATLFIEPGSVLVFDRSESTKVEPDSFLGGTELVVRGRLVAERAEFRFPGRTGGIVVDGGSAEFGDCRIFGAEAGLTLAREGTAAVRKTLSISDCRVGLALFPAERAGLVAEGQVVLSRNGVGAVRFPGAPFLPARIRAEGSEEADILSWDGAGPPPASAAPVAEAVAAAGALFLADTFIDHDRTWSGDVVIDGVVRVAPGATLTILPGSRVFFSFRDSDEDGVGESGIFVQGTLEARGTESEPILFLPERGRKAGSWDSINFMASDARRNRLEHVSIVGAFRGLHAHFSRLAGRRIRIEECYRGVQFQESDVDLDGVEVVSARSALRCRDSNVRLAHFRALRVTSGGNFFRSVVALSEPDLFGGWYGLRFRESRAEVRGGSVHGAFVGISVQEGTVRLAGVTVASAGLAGFALQEGDVTMTGCRAAASRLDGASATRARVVIDGGGLTGFGRHALKLGGPAAVVLRGVDLGAAAGGRAVIYDGRVAPGLGVVRIE